MTKISITLLASLLILTSCKNDHRKILDDNTAYIDTASVEQLEEELKNLEEQSSTVNQKIDSIDNLLNE